MLLCGRDCLLYLLIILLLIIHMSGLLLLLISNSSLWDFFLFRLILFVFRSLFLVDLFLSIFNVILIFYLRGGWSRSIMFLVSSNGFILLLSSGLLLIFRLISISLKFVVRLVGDRCWLLLTMFFIVIHVVFWLLFVILLIFISMLVVLLRLNWL